MSDMAKEDIDVVRTVMSLVDKASHDQDPDMEDARRCVSQLLNEVRFYMIRKDSFFRMSYSCFIINLFGPVVLNFTATFDQMIYT